MQLKLIDTLHRPSLYRYHDAIGSWYRVSTCNNSIEYTCTVTKVLVQLAFDPCTDENMYVGPKLARLPIYHSTVHTIFCLYFIAALIAYLILGLILLLRMHLCGWYTIRGAPKGVLQPPAPDNTQDCMGWTALLLMSMHMYSCNSVATCSNVRVYIVHVQLCKV